MTNDPILAEVRLARKSILETYKGDCKAMLLDMMKKQWDKGHVVFNLKKNETQLK